MGSNEHSASNLGTLAGTNYFQWADTEDTNAECTGCVMKTASDLKGLTGTSLLNTGTGTPFHEPTSGHQKLFKWTGTGTDNIVGNGNDTYSTNFTTGLVPGQN